MQLELREDGQDILSISISSTCQHLSGGKCCCFLCRYFFMKLDFNRTIWLAVKLPSCEINRTIPLIGTCQVHHHSLYPYPHKREEKQKENLFVDLILCPLFVYDTEWAHLLNSLCCGSYMGCLSSLGQIKAWRRISFPQCLSSDPKPNSNLMCDIAREMVF